MIEVLLKHAKKGSEGEWRLEEVDGVMRSGRVVMRGHWEWKTIGLCLH